MGRVILCTKPIRVAFNMLCCATLFFWARVRPRETISGLFGRKARGDEHPNAFWVVGEKAIDWMHPHEAQHCLHTWQCEQAMRATLYGFD